MARLCEQPALHDLILVLQIRLFDIGIYACIIVLFHKLKLMDLDIGEKYIAKKILL